jgi:hypothetical protein
MSELLCSNWLFLSISYLVDLPSLLSLTVPIDHMLFSPAASAATNGRYRACRVG